MAVGQARVGAGGQECLDSGRAPVPDGSVQRISAKASDQNLLRLFGRADGEVLDRDDVILGSRAGTLPIRAWR